MNIGNMKVSTRLTAGFGIVLALLIAVAVLAITRISSINTTTTHIVSERYSRVKLAIDIRNQANAQAHSLSDAIIGSHDPEEVKSSLDKLEVSIKANRELREALKARVVSRKGAELMQELNDHANAYGAARSKVIQLVQQDKPDEAGVVLLKEVRPLFVKFVDAAQAVVDQQDTAMTTDATQAEADGQTAIVYTLILASIAAIASIAIGVLITRSITRPLGAAVQVATNVAAGDLTTRIEVNTTDETGQLLQALKDMQNGLIEVVGQVRGGSESVASASAQIASGNADLSGRTEEQASALEETAASMEELSSTVKQNADNARQANQLAQSASTVAIKGGDVVSQVVETMKGINDSSKRIADIISVIDGIAFQTNILALNAAVEAARAGEQGRGFAVVATEVRSLAGRSADAAKEIKTLINASVERVEQGTVLVDEAGATMSEVVASIKRVTDIMGEISAASNEQSLGVSQVGEAVVQMDQTTQQNAALVEEMSAAADSLKSQANELVQVVSVFKLDQSTTYRAPSSRAPAPKAVAFAKPAPGLASKPGAAKSSKPLLSSPKLERSAGTQAQSKSNDAGDWESF